MVICSNAIDTIASHGARRKKLDAAKFWFLLVNYETRLPSAENIDKYLGLQQLDEVPGKIGQDVRKPAPLGPTLLNR